MWNPFSPLRGAESSSGTWIVGAPKGVSESPVVPSRALRLRGLRPFCGSSGSTGAGSVKDEKVMPEEANCYLLKVTAIKASLTLTSCER